MLFMDRTFHRRVSPYGIAAVVMLGVAALACFWQHTGPMALVGVAVAAVAMTGVERMVHTTYVLRSDGSGHDVLVVDRGRLARPQQVRVADITAVQVVGGAFLRDGYVRVEYGCGRIMALAPESPEAFVAEVKRRQAEAERREDGAHGGL